MRVFRAQKNRLLAPSPELSDLIRDIGVEQVDHPGVIARFVLPELGTVPPDDRHKLLHHVRLHWEELKQDQELINHFKEVSFVVFGGGGFSDACLLSGEIPKRGEGIRLRLGSCFIALLFALLFLWWWWLFAAFTVEATSRRFE